MSDAAPFLQVATSRDVYGDDIFDEPAGDSDTLANLGPLAALAGVWEGTKGYDSHPIDDGAEIDVFTERYELQPIDRQTNGPQLFYGLRYHTHVTTVGEIETFHDQVGYWLWEPEAQVVTMSLAIPRGQVLLAAGPAAAHDTEFEVRAVIDSPIYGILSNPFLDRAFRTVGFRMRVSINPDGTWSYDEQTDLVVIGRDEVYAHVDRNTLSRVAGPQLNPLARGEAATSAK